MTQTHAGRINRKPPTDTKEQKRIAPGLLGLKERTKMSSTNQQKLDGVTRSWARAKKLKALTAGNLQANLNSCRQFLAATPNSKGYKELLDAGKDLRNTETRRMLRAFKTFLTTLKNTKIQSKLLQRISKGNPNRPARAGAPDLMTKIGFPKRRKDQIPHPEPSEIPIGVLQDLTNIQRKHSVTLDQIYVALKGLGKIQETLQGIPK